MAPKKQTPIWAADWLIQRKLRPLLHRHGASEDGTVVDVGCGTSPYRGYFPRAKQFIRIDRDPRDEDVTPGDATQLPLSDGSVKCVLATQMLGDLPDLRGIQ